MLTSGNGRLLGIVDFSGAGWNNVDFGLFRFLMTQVHRYYAGQIKMILGFNFPRLLSPVFTFGKWLAGSQSSMYSSISFEDIFTYIDRSQVPKYVGGDNPIDFTKPPPGSVSYKKKLPSYVRKEDFEYFLQVTKDLRTNNT